MEKNNTTTQNAITNHFTNLQGLEILENTAKLMK
jgi:hypothetical protein